MPDFGPERWRATEKPDIDAVEWSLTRWNRASADDRKTSHEEKARDTAVSQSSLFLLFKE